MARKPATTKATGGGGYGFEDQVASHYALELLAARRSFGIEFGRIVRIDYQAHDEGWLLDDLVATFESQHGLHRLACSIRSNRQVTIQNGFPADFVNDIWEQWLDRDSSPFQEGRDRLSLLVGKLAGSVESAWNEMLSQARATSPTRFVARFTTEGQSSALQRTLFRSLGCPPHWADGERTNEVAAAKLLAHLELRHFDFGSSGSRHWTNIITVAQDILESGDADEAARLAETLCLLCWKLRPDGGTLDFPTILGRLRKRYRLKIYPDYQADWKRLHEKTQSALARTKSVVANGITLDRQSLRNKVSGAILESQIVVLLGESGCGKSALVKELASSSSATTDWVWFGGEELEGGDLRSVCRSLALQNQLEDVILASVKDRTIVVFDALDRASSVSLHNACELVSRLRLGTKDCPIRVLITAESAGWERIQREFVRSGVSHMKLETCSVRLPDQADVRRLLLQIPSLRAVANQTEVSTLLQNLKVLDWVAMAAEQGRNPATLSGVGMTQVIDWVWEFWIGDDSDALARSSVLKKIGESEGDSLGSGLPLHGAFDQSEQRMLGTPRLRRLIRVENERCYFLHDLAGEWARSRILLGQKPDALNLLAEKAKLPRWHRAIRYFGQRLLEETPEDATQWQTMLNGLGDVDPPTFAHDLFLEAVVFSANASVLMDQVWPVLVANKGALLRRLLRQFLHGATIPDPRINALTSSPSEANALASSMRRPHGPHWIPVLRLLRQHQDEVANLAMAVAARVCGMWLETVPEKNSDNRPFPGRQDAAELALRLARELQFHKAVRTYFKDKSDETIYETLLLAAPDLPDEVGRLALEFAQRRDWDQDVLDRAKEFRERVLKHRAAIQESDAERAARAAHAKTMLALGTVIPRGPLRDPWPDGPRRGVDDAFREVCHEKPQSFLRLINTSPAVAREVALAVCIEPPRHETYGWDSQLFNHCGLEHWSSAYPDAFFHSFFLTFLRQEPEVGLDLIIALVDFATERRVLAGSERHGGSASPSPEQLGPPMLMPNGDTRHLLGNSYIYSWYRFGGLDHSAASCALMALEKWLYEEIEAEHDVSSWINLILEQHRSVAITGVLVALGLSRPELFTEV